MDKNVYTSLFACFKIFVSTENLEVRLYWGLCGSFVSATKEKKKSNVDLFITIVYLKFLTSVEVISEKVWIFRYHRRNFKFS